MLVVIGIPHPPHIRERGQKWTLVHVQSCLVAEVDEQADDHKEHRQEAHCSSGLGERKEEPFDNYCLKHLLNLVVDRSLCVTLESAQASTSYASYEAEGPFKNVGVLLSSQAVHDHCF